jgi:hypothetical protein
MSTLGNVEFAEYRIGLRRSVSGSLCVWEVWRRVEVGLHTSLPRGKRVYLSLPPRVDAFFR